MVSRYRTVLTCLTLSVSAVSHSYTEEELRAFLNASESEHAKRAQDVKLSELHNLLPKNTPSSRAKPTQPSSEINQKDTSCIDGIAKCNSSSPSILPPPKAAGVPNEGEGIVNSHTSNGFRLPENEVESAPGKKPDLQNKSLQSSGNNNVRPPRSAAQKNGNHSNSSINNSTTISHSNLPPSWRSQPTEVTKPHKDEVDKSKRVIFGIRTGQAFKAQLANRASNADPALVELTVEEDVIGDFKTLSKGSKLFFKSTYNQGSNRLDLALVKGIDNRFEFEANGKGHVRDIANNAGLVGVVSADKKIIDRSLMEGVYALANTTASSMATNNPVSTAVSASTGSMIEQGKDFSDQSLGTSQHVIVVEPQYVYVRIDSTF